MTPWFLDNLLASNTAPAQSTSSATDIAAQAQSLLDQVKADLNLTQGEIIMWIPDMPNVPPQNVPVMIAQANQAQAGDAAKVRTIGVCSPSPNNNYSLENVVIPLTTAGDYLRAYEHRTPPATVATATIVQQPKHGVLRLVTQADVGTILEAGGDPVDPAAALYLYLPDSNYVGDDTATIQVDFGNGLKVNVKYFFQAISGGLGNDWAGDYCSKTGPYWKISSTLDANGNSTVKEQALGVRASSRGQSKLSGSASSSGSEQALGVRASSRGQQARGQSKLSGSEQALGVSKLSGSVLTFQQTASSRGQF